MSNDISKVYDSVSNAYDERYTDRIHLVEDDIIGALIKSVSATTTLDVGCGTGHAVTLGDIDGVGYRGIDLSQVALDVAMQKHPNHIFGLSDATTLKPSWAFDLILFIYGQVNYIGLDATVKIINEQGCFGSKFMAVLYCGDGHADYGYTKDFQNYFAPSEIEAAFAPLGGKVNGFSFYDVPVDYDAQWQATLNRQIKDGDEYGCKYLIASNLDVLKHG